MCPVLLEWRNRQDFRKNCIRNECEARVPLSDYWKSTFRNGGESGQLHGYVNCTVTRDAMLRRAPCLIYWSAFTVLQFLIFFEQRFLDFLFCSWLYEQWGSVREEFYKLLLVYHMLSISNTFSRLFLPPLKCKLLWTPENWENVPQNIYSYLFPLYFTQSSSIYLRLHWPEIMLEDNNL